MNRLRLAAANAAGSAVGGQRRGKLWVLVLSYVFDWAVLAVCAAVGFVLGDVAPNKHPFSLNDPSISFPNKSRGTVPDWLLFLCCAVAPAIITALISLIFVPGPTASRRTPQSLIWKLKLWELHTAWLGLALSLISTWVITNGLKNMYGKPRPDLLARCQPDLARVREFVVGGIASGSSFGGGQLVSADICTNPDGGVVDDGFRSYPSGHASSSAAGLVYLSLFMASKFAVVIPFCAVPSGHQADASAHAAFPSRTHAGTEKTAPPTTSNLSQALPDIEQTVYIAATRRQAAAPPLYLLLIAVIPTLVAIFIGSSRWFDYRHFGFDILSGFIIGTAMAFFAFRYYHLPISRGAGWAWGPRSAEKAFWVGVGSASYATDKLRPGDEEEGLGGTEVDVGRGPGVQFENGGAQL